MEEAVQERAGLKEKDEGIFSNGKGVMAVLDTAEFERHTCGALHGIFVAAGGAKTAVTAEWNKLEVTAVGAGVHGAAK